MSNDFNAEKALIQQLSKKDELVDAFKEKLEEAEEEGERLQEEINRLALQLEKLRDGDSWQWRHIRMLKNSTNGWEETKVADTNFGLPTPRLELRHRDKSDFDHIVDYGLVTEHLLGHIMFIPIGSTRIGGGYGVPDYLSDDQKDLRNLALPFRDGVHIKHDMKRLNLPGFVVNVSKRMYLQIGEDDPTAEDIVHVPELGDEV